MAAVLITVQNNTVDYSTDNPNIQVVLVDFDKFDPDTSFPDDVEAAMREVMELPTTMPWRGGILKRLKEVHRTIKAGMLDGPTYAKEGNYGRGIKRSPGGNASNQRESEQVASAL